MIEFHQNKQKGKKMIQITKKAPHSPRQVLGFSENHKKHTLEIRTQGNGTSAAFFAKLNKAELAKLCDYIEKEFQIHKEDI